MQTLWLLVPLFLIVIFLVPIGFEFRLVFNPLKNVGFVSLKVLGIRVKLAEFKIKDTSLIVITKKGAELKELEVSGEKIRLLEQFSIQIKDKIKIKKFEFHSNVGLNDAFKSAMISGLICSLVNMAMGYVKNFKQTSEVRVVGHTSYNEKKFQLGALGRLSISLFDALYCFVMASLITRRSDKYDFRRGL